MVKLRNPLTILTPAKARKRSVQITHTLDRLGRPTRGHDTPQLPRIVVTTTGRGKEAMGIRGLTTSYLKARIYYVTPLAGFGLAGDRTPWHQGW